MQPMYRPSIPPQGMRPPGVPPPRSLPSGLPPPQRPPAGYRPIYPIGSLPPQQGPPTGPISKFSSEPSPKFAENDSSAHPVKPLAKIPVEKFASMNLNQSNVIEQNLSNGMPPVEKPASPAVQPSYSAGVSNFNDSSSSNTESFDSKSYITSESSLVSSTASSSSDSIQHRFTKDASQDVFSTQSMHSQSLSATQETSANFDFQQPSVVSSSLTSSGLNTSSFPSGARSSTVTFNTSSQPHQHTMFPSTSVSSGNITSQTGTITNSPYSVASQPPRPNIPAKFGQVEHQFDPHRSTIPTASSQLGALSGEYSPSQMVSPVPNFPTPASHVGAPRPSLPPLISPVGPPRPGFPPVASPMGQPRPGIPLLSSQMGHPHPGMHPPASQMGTPRPGLPPMTNTIRANSEMSYASTPQMGSLKPGLNQSPMMGSPGGVLSPSGSYLLPPQNDTNFSKPGMPPQPTGSYIPGPNAGLPPPLTSSQMGPGTSPGVPPSNNASHLQAPGMGSMQNRYPCAGQAGSPVGYPQGTQGKRLNPDDMPSPLEVMEEDRHCKSGEFLTNMKGGLPPLVTTDFVVKDGGNASPRFIRSTMYNVPSTPDMMKQSMIPFGLTISPLADLNDGEAPIYIGTSLANGPVRCNRCKGYMSPLMNFMDGGRRFQCLLCKQINEVPADYYCHMDSQGARADKYQRPELCLGSYEYLATPEYCKDKILPKEPAFIFVMEMSQMMVQRGIINFLCQNMKSILNNLPRDETIGSEVTKSKIHVGFITYDSSVHFYKLTGLAPEMCIVCDKENMFVPVPDGVLCDVEEVSAIIDKLMESIPQNFQTTRETSGSLSCAIQAGMSALKASGRVGKLFVFHSSLPQVEGVGKLKNREDRKLLGTDKEKTILGPQNTHYNNLAQDLVGVGCGVDFYIFNESYVDLATIGQVARLTGGQCYKYTFFQLNKDAERLLDDLKINIGRNIAFDAIMRVRTSTGVRPVDFFGHFYMSNTHDIELAVIDSAKAVVIEIKHDDKITEEDGVYIQVALLYTSIAGQRRLRILNLALNICIQMADLYKNCDLDTLMNYFGKQSMFKFLETSAKQIKENLIARTSQMLACYRKNCATPSPSGQLILPELLKLLPLYVNSLSKCDALSGGQDLTCDDRSWHIYQLSTMNVEATVAYFYPRLIPLADVDPQEVGVPNPVRTSYEKLNPDGVYLLENGLFMFMWVGSGTSASWMKDVFGVSAPHQLDPVLSELPELENPLSKRVRGIIEAVREHRKQHVRLFVVPQQGKHEVIMRNYLVEDKGVFGSPSYVDFLCHIHKEIRALLS